MQLLWVLPPNWSQVLHHRSSWKPTLYSLLDKPGGLNHRVSTRSQGSLLDLRARLRQALADSPPSCVMASFSSAAAWSPAGSTFKP